MPGVRPQAATPYIAEIRKITQAPIKYVVYNHHHYDHIAGGKPFKDDVRDLKQYMTELSEVVKKAAAEGKCWDTAMKEIKLPEYEKWGSYEPFLPGNIERFCSYRSRG